MKILRRKIKKFATEKETKDKAKTLNSKEFSLISVNEKRILMTEKEIFSIKEMVEDIKVDSTQIHFCDHDEKKRIGCKLLNIAKAKKHHKNIKKEDLLKKNKIIK